jgi:hypothetical protein
MEDLKIPDLYLNSLFSHSEKRGNLFKALALAQLTMEEAQKESSNFRNKFANLAEIIRSTRPYLNKQGLSVVQEVVRINGDPGYLITTLGHESDEWMRSIFCLIPTDNPNLQHAEAGGVTYWRRFCYSSLIGAICDEDTDGQVKNNDNKKKYNQKEEPKIDLIPQYIKHNSSKITKVMVDILEKELQTWEGPEEVRKQIYNNFEIKSFADCSEKQYNAIIDLFEEWKK